MENGEKDKVFTTDEGTPQGGVISPLLANIALHGLENHITEWVKTWKCKSGQADGVTTRLT